MPAGPPPALEWIAAALIPPACREEVLGDLAERYSGPVQYVGAVARVVPFVVASRIWRTTDAMLLFTQTLLVYACFLAGMWHSHRSFLTGTGGLLWPAIPTAAWVIELVYEKAWAGSPKWASVIVNSIALGIGITLSVPGYAASLVLVTAVNVLFGSGLGVPREACGPALREHRVSINLPRIARLLFSAVGAVALAALILAAFGLKQGLAGLGTLFVFVLAVMFRMSRER